MNTELKLKLLQYLNQKKQGLGLTFFELMAVIVFLGLVVVGWVYYFDYLPQEQARIYRRRFLEPRNYVRTINKGQQAYYTEKSQFSPNIPDLQVGIRTASINYNYHVKVINSGTQTVAIGYSTATNKNGDFRNYVGYVSLILVEGSFTEVTSAAILCQQKYDAPPLSLDIEWKPGIEPPRCNKDQIQVDQVQVGGTN